jgi:hypothetical protein
MRSGVIEWRTSRAVDEASQTVGKDAARPPHVRNGLISNRKSFDSKFLDIQKRFLKHSNVYIINKLSF